MLRPGHFSLATSPASVEGHLRPLYLAGRQLLFFELIVLTGLTSSLSDSAESSKKIGAASAVSEVVVVVVVVTVVVVAVAVVVKGVVV